MRGINIQWPFSQFILHGDKTVECRRYPLASRGFAMPGEELWLIETPGKTNRRKKVLNRQYGPRPDRAHVVGIVSFAASFEYHDVSKFDDDSHRHCISTESSFRWRGGGKMHGWHVQTARPMKRPVEAGKKEVIGWHRKHTLCLS